MGNKLITVIVPVYNVEKYLSRCIDSICGQTYKNLQIILIDDGSTDNSSKICDDYIKYDCRIEVVHQENRGQSVARNIALNMAKGEYIAFVDSDDWIELDMYENMLRISENTSADIVICGYNSIIEGVQNVIDNHSMKVSILDLEDFVRGLVINNTMRLVIWNKLFRKTLLDDVRFNEGEVFEEIYFFQCIFWKTNRFAFIDYPYYNYLLERPGSTKSYFSDKKMKVFDQFNKFLYMLANNTNSEVVEMFKLYMDNFYVGLYMEAYNCNGLNKDKKRIIKEFNKNFKIKKKYITWIGSKRSAFLLAFRISPLINVFFYKLFK